MHTVSAEPGEDYQITVALPPSYGSGSVRYPVLFVLDGDVLFGTAAEMAALLGCCDGVLEVIVVAVGYGARPHRNSLRSRDLTPTVAPEPTAGDTVPGAGLLTGGGAPAFLAFLRETVIPFVEARYRTEPEQRGIFGHSHGGLFALYALFHAPDSFSRYIVGSPSLWWDRRVTLAFEERYAASHADLEARVFIAGGELEESAADARSVRFRQVSNWIELAERLRARGYPSLRLETHVFPGETHLSVVPFSLSRGLRALYGRREDSP